MDACSNKMLLRQILWNFPGFYNIGILLYEFSKLLAYVLMGVGIYPFFLNGGAPLFDENKIVKFCAAIEGAPFSLFLLYKVFSKFS